MTEPPDVLFANVEFSFGYILGISRRVTSELFLWNVGR